MTKLFLSHSTQDDDLVRDLQQALGDLKTRCNRLLFIELSFGCPGGLSSSTRAAVVS